MKNADQKLMFARIEMGNANHPSRSLGSGELDVGGGGLSSGAMKGAPLLFHATHSDNVQVSASGRVAHRADSFCKGICFSARRVAVGERVCVRVSATSTLWSGVLRFGFTRHDPAGLRAAELPSYACPDLTSRPGYWAKALPERCARAGATLVFRLTRTGDVMLTADGEDRGVFFGSVDTDAAAAGVWALIDIYGNTTTAEFLDCGQLNNLVASPLPQTMSPPPACLPPPADVPGPGPLPLPLGAPALQPMPFHTCCGRNVCLSPDRTVAVRLRHALSNGYAFTSRPVLCGQRLVIQVLSQLPSAGGIATAGGLGFGMTATDPATVLAAELPDDADQLLDRPEYWVVNKDVCSPLDVADQLSFHLTTDGEVRLSKNGQNIASLMHVDKTLPMWMFFDVYGNTQKIKSLGVICHPSHALGLSPRAVPPSRLTVSLPPTASSRTPPPRPPPLRITPTTTVSASSTSTAPPSLPPKQYKSPSAPSAPSRPPHPGVVPGGLPPPLIPTLVGHAAATPPLAPRCAPPAVIGATATATTPESNEDEDNENNANTECAVCFERPVNCVLYKCGHMCVCFECATDIVDNQGALCPICRNTICDIIKIYRS